MATKPLDEILSDTILKKHGLTPDKMTGKQKIINLLALTLLPDEDIPGPEEFNDILEEFITAALKVKAAILLGIEKDKYDPMEKDKYVPLEQITTVSACYDPIKNTLEIDAHKDSFDEKFLQYALEYQKIPKNAKIIFTKDNIKQN